MASELRKKALIQAIDNACISENKGIYGLLGFCSMVRWDGDDDLLSDLTMTRSTCKQQMSKIISNFYKIVSSEEIDEQLKLLKTDHSHPLITGEIEKLLHENLTRRVSCSVCDGDD